MPRIILSAEVNFSKTACATPIINSSDIGWMQKSDSKSVDAPKFIFFGLTAAGIIKAMGQTLLKLLAAGHQVSVVAVNDKESIRWAEARDFPGHLKQSLTISNVCLPVVGLGYCAENFNQFAHQIARGIPLGPGDCVFAPWRHDGVQEFEACGRIALAAARNSSATCWQYPVNARRPFSPMTNRLFNEANLFHFVYGSAAASGISIRHASVYDRKNLTRLLTDEHDADSVEFAVCDFSPPHNESLSSVYRHPLKVARAAIEYS